MEISATMEWPFSASVSIAGWKNGRMDTYKKISQKHKEHPSASGIETGKNVFYSFSTSSSMWLFVFVTK